MFALPSAVNESSHDAIRLADWVELNLLMEKKSSVSVTDITDELADIPPDVSNDSEHRFEYDSSLSLSEDYRSPNNGQVRHGFWEQAEGNAEAAFMELSQRARWLGERSPVEIERDAAFLSHSRKSREVDRFLVLLRARQLYQGALEDDGDTSGFLFEELAKHALGAYIGSRLDHRLRFGVAGGHRGDELPDLLPEAVEKLRQLFHEPPGEVPRGAQGDFKADAVAWKPFGDELPGQLVIIGQATISEGDWKKDEPSKKWTDRQPPEERLINFVARPLTAVIFPETLSLTPIEALEGLKFSSVPFDRLRLLSLLRDEDLPSKLCAEISDWVSGMKERLPL